MSNVDRRFGKWNSFGDASQFGASVMEASLAYALEIDWDGDGVFTGASEARYMCGYQVSRGRTSMLKAAGDGFDTLRTGTAVFSLWNDDGRFDGWNSASPLYPNVAPGKDVQFSVRNLLADGRVVDDVFYGVIADIVPMSYGDRPKVNIYVEDGWNFLRNYSARVALQQNISVDTAIGLVLDSVGWLDRWGRGLGASSDMIRYWWGNGDKSAAAECEDLANSAFGNFFIGADGRARFITRAAVSSSVADFTDSDLGKDVRNPQPWENFRNVMQLKVHLRDQSGTVQLFEQFGVAPSIPDGEEYVDFVAYTYNGNSVPALSISAPVANVDYTINSNESGSGSDVSASCTVTVTNLGDRAKRSIVNNSGGTAYVTSFEINGAAVYERNLVDVFYPSDPSVVNSPRKFVSDLIWQQNLNTASDLCANIGPFLAGLHPFPTVEVESNYDNQFGIELFDVCTYTSEKLGIDGIAFHIGGIDHETLDENCQRVKTTFYLEPYVASGNYGAFPLTWGESTFGW